MRTLLTLAMLFFVPVQDETDKGVVSGLVVHAGTGEPIRGAEVLLRSINPKSSYVPPTAVTDAEGRFRIVDVLSGAYHLTVTRNGFATAVHGSRHHGLLGLLDAYGRPEADTSTVIQVAGGQHEIVSRLMPSATISGRILGQNAEPLVSMQVELLRSEFDTLGRRQLTPVVQTITNDRGEYRFHNFSPGRYYLAARWAQWVGERAEITSSVSVVSAVGSNGRDYTAAYYPGTPDVEQAVTLDVSSGPQLVSIDLTLQKARPQASRKVIIRVVYPESTNTTPGATRSLRGSVSLRNRSYLSSGGFSFSQELNADGTLQRDIPDGTYWLAGRMDPSDGGPAGQSLAGLQRIDVAGVDVEVVLRLLPVTTLKGVVTIDGRAPAGGGYEKTQIQLIATEAVGGPSWLFPALAAGVGEPEGYFSIPDIGPFDYWLRVTNLPADTYLAEAQWNKTDALKETLSVVGPASGELRIGLRTTSNQLDGLVSEAGGRPAAGVEAVLIPDGPNPHPDRYKSARTDAHGRFVLRGVAPGDYRLYSWARLPQHAYLNPDYMRSIQSQGHAIRVEDGSKLSAEITLIEDPSPLP